MVPISHSDTFFPDLVEKLHNPDKNEVRRVALEALAFLNAVNRDAFSPRQFNIKDLKAIDSIDGLDDAAKRRLCKEITKVFAGCRWKGNYRALFDRAVNTQYAIGFSPWDKLRAFGRRPAIAPLPIAVLNGNLHLFYEILAKAENACAAHIEELSANSKLMGTVHAVITELPQRSDLGKVLEICRSLPELLVDLMPILFEVDQNRKMEALTSSVSLFKGNAIKYSYSHLLKALRGVPKEERLEVISFAKQLIKGNESVNYRVKAIEAIAGISKGERSDVMKRAAALKSAPNVIRAVGAIPADDRGNVLNFVAQLIKPHYSEKMLVTFIRMIRAIGKEERKEVIAKAKLLTNDKDSAEELAYIIFAVSCFSEGIDAAAPLIRQSDIAFDRMKIIEAISQAPQEERMYLAGKATLFINEQSSCLDRARVVKTISDIPNEKRDDAIDKTLLLINENDREDGVSILKGLGSLSREERVQVYILAKQVIKSIGSTFTWSHILETLIGIPKAIRAEVVREVKMSNDSWMFCLEMKKISALKSFPPEERLEVLAMAGTDIDSAQVLQVIRNIPKEEREEILSLASPLFKYYLGKTERAKLFEAIAAIRKENRVYTISMAKRLMRYVCALSDFLDIQMTIRRIPIDDLDDVTLKTQYFIDKDSRSRNAILEAMAGIPAKDRQDLVDKVLPLIKDKYDGIHLAKMLKAMGALSPQGRADVINLAQFILKEGDTPYVAVLLLTNLAGITDGERLTVIRLAAPFNMKGGAWRFAHIAREISSIPKEERSDIIANVKQLVKEEDQSNRKMAILNALKLFPREERDHAVLLAEEQDGDPSDFLVAISGIPQAERSEVLKQAAPLTGATGGYCRAHMSHPCWSEEDRAGFIEKNDEDCLNILEAMGGMTEVERAELIESGVSLIGDAINADCRGHIVQAIGGIPKEDRSDVIGKTVILVQEGADLGGSAYIIEALGGISKEDRSDVIAKAHLFLKLISMKDTIYIPSSMTLGKAIRKIGAIPKEERRDVLNTAATLMDDDDIESCYFILDAISGLPKEIRGDFALQLPFLMAGIRSRVGKMVFLGLISMLTDFSEQIIRECLIICNSANITLNDYEAFRLIPHNHFLEMINAVANHPRTIHAPFWKEFCAAYSLIKERNYEVISDVFDTLKGEVLVQTAQWILLFADNRLIDPDHPLVERALAAIGDSQRI